MIGLRVATYNVLEYQMYPDRDGEQERYAEVARVIGEVDADIWAIQEVAGERALLELADATGLRCQAQDMVACDPGRNGFGVGLLWKPGLEPVPGTLRTYTDDVFFHGLVKIVLDAGDVRLQAASTHLTPFGSPQTVTEARRAVSLLQRPVWRQPGFVGSDSNGVTADRVYRDGRWECHADDPYVDQKWHESFIWQCKWRYDARTGHRVHRADRTAGDVFWSGGLYDTGAIADTRFAATAGHWIDDPYGARDIDHLRVTTELVTAVRDVRVHTSDRALCASDHLPKVTDFDLSNLNH